MENDGGSARANAFDTKWRNAMDKARCDSIDVKDGENGAKVTDMLLRLSSGIDGGIRSLNWHMIP